MENPWGIVIAVAAFLIQFITFGICLSFGIYVIELQNEFDSGLSIISSIGSINIGFQLSSGPFASFLMRKMSYRKVCLLGAIMSSVGLSVLPFTPNIPYLIAFFGVITGIGFCFLYVPSHTLSGLWFDKNRGLVTGIVTSGSSLGGVVFPHLIELLIEVFGWRGSFYILAALNLQTILLSGLMRESPIQRSWKKLKTKNINNGSDLTDSTKTIYTIAEINGSINCQNGATSKHNSSGIDVTKKNTKEQRKKSLEEKSRAMRLLTNLPYILYTINNLLWNFGGSVHLLLGPDYYTKVGLDVTQAASLLSVEQGIMTVGCVLGGILGNHRKINRCILFLATNFVTGSCLLAFTVPVFHTMGALAIINSLFGLSFGTSLGLLVILVSDFLGSELIGEGMGYLLLACGIGTFIGPPFGGYLVQRTGSYDMAYYLAGAATMLSGLVLMVVPIRDCFRRSKTYFITVTEKGK
ncbi:monocarboxylate transporter 9-like [Saccostrea echinata]|uniref:monocarboxylate transporter 9-like n=1 Tax=Saccostrea echinata TaxID=191078 RepID=UPI002A82C740|nr:monocarboxylate transporter 9-like [Saccostrea echinata]